jgi:glycosyltransferase involved in cell wall biosynthesis
MIIKATIIIMSYNHQDFILNLLQSLINFYNNELYEIIISDDASDDKTTEIVRQYTRDYSNVNLIEHKTNMGIMSNLISALSSSSGRSIFLISGDDFIISDGFLNERLSILESNPEISAVFMRSILTFNGNYNIVVPKKSLNNKKIILHDFIRGLNLPTNGMVFRNYFLTKSNLDKLIESSKNVEFNDDLFMTAYLLTKGSILQSSYLGYVQRIFIKNKNSNYNSIFSKLQKLNNEYITLESISVMIANKLSVRYLVLFIKELYLIFTIGKYWNVFKIIKKYYNKIPYSPFDYFSAFNSLYTDYYIRRFFRRNQ